MDNKAWLFELNRRLCNNWKDIAVFLNIEEVEQKKFQHGEEIYGIFDWLKVRRETERIWEAAVAIDRSDVITLKPSMDSSTHRDSVSFSKGRDMTEEFGTLHEVHGAKPHSNRRDASKSDSAVGTNVGSEIRVFISYSHDDKNYVDDEKSISILKFIRGLENEINVVFWHDKRISTGELWDEEIQKNINASKMAICLVSQSFIDSRYITDVEVSKFLKKRKKEGMIIYPIILSSCDWSDCEWLQETRYIPSDNKNIKRNYREAGKREELYTTIRREIKQIISNMNDASQSKTPHNVTVPVQRSKDSQPVTVAVKHKPEIEKKCQQVGHSSVRHHRESKERRFYATFGAPATGKTELIKMIKTELKGKLYCKTYSITEKYNSPFDAYLQKLFVEGDHSYFIRFQLESFASRAGDAFKAIIEGKSHQISLIDETIYDSYAYARALYNLHLKRQNGLEWLPGNDYQTFRNVFNSFEKYIPKPDAIIYLRCNDINSILNKYKDKVRPFEYPDGYIEQLLLDYEELANDMEEEWQIKVIPVDIDGQKPIDIFEQVISQLGLHKTH